MNKGDWHIDVPNVCSPHFQTSFHIQSCNHICLSLQIWSYPHIWSSPHQAHKFVLTLVSQSQMCTVASWPMIMISMTLIPNHPLTSPHIQSSPYIWWMQIRLPNPTMQPSLITPRTLTIQGIHPRNLSNEPVLRFGQMEYICFLKSREVLGPFSPLT